MANRGAKNSPDKQPGRLRMSDYTIRDQASFQTVAGSGHEIAGLYALAGLDVLIDLARLVSLDFFARPELYKQLDDPELAERLAQLNAQYGCNERLLDHEQRKAVFTPMFDDDAGDFIKARDELLVAAATFSKWGQATGIPMLREVVRTKHVPFKKHLTRFNGPSLAWSRGIALPYLTDEVSYRILRDRGVTSVFSITRPPIEAWPYQEDENGEELVEKICKCPDTKREPALTRHEFSAQQRTALRGAEAIAAALDYAPHDRDEADVDVLITKCTTWYMALHEATELVVTISPSEWSAAMVNGDRRAPYGQALVSP